MPNKPHPPRTADLSKAGKGKKSTATAAAAEGDNNNNGEPAVKKPDTRTLVSGSASWTGKLPLNLLSEHCQRAKWEKPEYTMHRAPGGHIAGVILRAKNTRTGDVVVLPVMKMPNRPDAEGVESQAWAVRETAVEARHLAACWGLFRVASAKNLAMALPPGFRDLWKGDFAAVKKADVDSGKAWLYDADPFAAKIRHEEEVRLRDKERRDREEKREKDRKEKEEGRGLGGGKGWSRAPKVDMGRRMRRDVEALIREGTVWNPHDVVLKPAQKDAIVKEVTALGFRKAHVQEAVEESKDKEETLEWLLIHVPEDDLPKWCLPENYTAGVSLASGDVQRENKIKRLASAGYAVEVCNEALAAAGEDEGLAAERLQSQLLGDEESLEVDVKCSESTEFWNEEQAVLDSIYGDRYEAIKGIECCRIKLEISSYKGPKVSLFVRKPRAGYPHRWPVVAVEAELPAYIRLSIVKKALQDGLSDQIGEQMIFHLVDWLEQNVPSVIENPGLLKSISRAVGAGSEVSGSLKKRSQPRQHRMAVRPSPHAGAKMLADWEARQTTPQQQKMNAARQKLPAWQLSEDIVNAVNSSQVTIISGETGSGKSTQSVQFILDDMIRRHLGPTANIVCTQPRRISALGLADRVADERCSAVGHEVGYSIRGESRQKPGTTRITFMTTGVLLRRLQSSGGDAAGIAAALDDISHVVIDEVHERSLDTDFLMTLLRDVLKRRKDLKLILMSATLDAALFENYFTKKEMTVAKVQISGRTYPVTDIYLEDVLRITSFAGRIKGADDDDDGDDVDSGLGAAIRAVGARINYDLLATVVDYIDQELSQKGDADSGAILIFLPGTMEIDRTLSAIRRLSSKFHALPLHASLQPVEQRKVFPRAGPGKRKVIAATNVAETSITIEDVVAVIDTGRVKETSFDPQAGMVRLEEVWASQAACKQRRGRAGRVTAGTCYKLYTRNLESTRMPERPQPEIMRVPLEQLCLSVKAMGVDDVQGFLGKAITPPASLAVDSALTLLHKMNVLDAGAMTALGQHLALIPADLRCGKLLVLGAAFGCLEACLVIASVLSVRSPFVSPPDKREEANAAKASFHEGSGDLVCALRAYREWSEKRQSGLSPSSTRAWCGQNFLSHQTLMDVDSTRSQYLSTLQDIQFVNRRYTPSDISLNAHNSNAPLLRALIAASFNPQLARIEFPDAKYAASVSGAVALDPEARTIKYFTERSDSSAGNERVFVHPSSTLFSAQNFPTNTAFVAYFTKMATSKVFLRDLTPCNVFALLMFGGEVALAATNGGGLLVDGWIRVRGWARIGVLVSRLRAMLDALLERKLADPGLDLGSERVVGVVRRLVELDGLDN
ncbi:hypothetical protein ANO11243_086540 [Dothideomycetidae sp. 11243]|nr:hypothetical protein ANO11243_086540 [fungal sp. No.11243]